MVPLKILLSKIGLDGHDRGIKVIARAFMDAGFEVVYTGLHKTAHDIVKAAIEEDVDAIGISILSGAHMTHFPRVLESLKQLGEEIPVFGGGIIPDEDIIELKKMGVKEIFVPGTSLQDIVDWVKNNIKKKTTLKIQ